MNSATKLAIFAEFEYLVTQTGGIMVITQRRAAKIIPIAGGKGGVGKTELCANLGVRLGQLGYRTVLIDLDLGGSNLHSTLGMKNRNNGLGNFLSDRSLGFANLIAPTPFKNLSFIPGDVLVAGTPNIMYSQKRSLINHIEKIDADYILIDLGSGASNNVVDFFLVSNSGIVITSPHVGAVLNAYSFLKNTVFRFLLRAFSGQNEVERFLRNSIKERRPGNPITVANVLAGMDALDKDFTLKARRYVKLMQPSMVLNLVRDADDLSIATSLRDLSLNNLDVDLNTLGMIVHDERIAKSHKNKLPMVESDPNCLFSREVDRIAQKIVQSPEFPNLALETGMYADSYELMKIESAADLAELQEQNTSHIRQNQSDAQEFLEILSAQKKQIHELKNTVRLLTLRNP